jgi:hypothetical protein
MDTKRTDADDWIHDARVQIYEETKHMNNTDIAGYMNKGARQIAKEHGLNLLFKSSPDSPAARLNSESSPEAATR